MILRRLGGRDEATYTRVTFMLYGEEADNDANKNSVDLEMGIRPLRKSVNQNVLAPSPDLRACFCITVECQDSQPFICIGGQKHAVRFNSH
jgi:hypothetical protein